MTDAHDVQTTTCYMCACRCGIRVHRDGDRIRYIEGNPDHPVNRGVICAKGSAGIKHHTSPARLRAPMKRVGPRGSGEFEEISWEEALETAAEWLGDIRKTDPRKLAFFTGRDQSQALTGWWARQFGTPNYAAHGGFCSVNMAAAGLYTIGGAFWEFGEPDWERTKLFLLFGVAEDHDSNPIKIGLGQIKGRGAKIVSINPVRSGYSAIADEWIGIRPGTDGLFVLSLCHELLRAGKVDADYLARYTNAGWLVHQAPGSENDGLFVRDESGAPVAWDRHRACAAPAQDTDTAPALRGTYEVAGETAVPAFQLMAERFLEARYAPDAVAAETGIDADVIRRLAAELAETAFEREVVIQQPWTDAFGRQHEKMVGRPVSMHAMRGISAHANGFHTCRAIHLLQSLLGSIDTPGGFRFKPPFPKPIPAGAGPAGKPGEVAPETPLPRMPLGFPLGPEDLLVDDDGGPRRIDSAFSWEAPMAIHGMMHTVIANAARGVPHRIDTLFLFMANMAWNSAMNSAATTEHLTATDPETGAYKIPHIIYADAFRSEMVDYADLVLPDTTYLERWDCMSMLDRPISHADGPADAIRQPVVKPDRDVRPFQEVMLDLGARLGLPGMVTPDGDPQYPGGYADYLTNHERTPGIGSLAGWRGPDGKESGTGAPNPNQLQAYIDNGCFWKEAFPAEARFFKHVNRAYLDYAADRKFIGAAEPVILQLYSETLQRFRLAARGHGPVQPPEEHRARIETYFDPLPFWYAPEDVVGDAGSETDYPLHAITQRPMSHYHSWGSQNAWLRQLHAENELYVPRSIAAEIGLSDGDWVYLTSRTGRIHVPVRLMDGLNRRTVWTWNAIGKKKGSWGLSADAPESARGFLLNNLIDDLLPERADGHRYSNSDPVTGQAAWYDVRVSMEKAPKPENVTVPAPRLEVIHRMSGSDARDETSSGTGDVHKPRVTA